MPRPVSGSVWVVVTENPVAPTVPGFRNFANPKSRSFAPAFLVSMMLPGFRSR